MPADLAIAGAAAHERSSAETRAFAAATVIITAHLVVTGVAHAAGGEVAIGAAALLAAMLAPPLWLAFATIRRPAASVLCGGLGAAAASTGIAVNAVHAALTGPRLVDVTGMPAAVAGLVLVALAFRLALAGRRRRVQVPAGIAVAFALLQWVLMPMLGAGLAANAGHPPIPPARSLGLAGARDVAFAAADGTRLAGWYVPGRGSAVVILLHGSHGSRRDTVAHLRMLVHAGYGVLAFDARGHGASGGGADALGWRGASDVAGAVAFVRRRRGVDTRRIAALGLSMGAEEALRAAANGSPLAAVVADGTGASTLGDQRLVTHGVTAPIALSTAWLSFRESELLTGDREPAPLTRIVAAIRQPVLLIASGARHERAFGAALQRRIGPRARLWYLAGTGHTRGLAEQPDRYASHVTRFLAEALGPRERPPAPPSIG